MNPFIVLDEAAENKFRQDFVASRQDARKGYIVKDSGERMQFASGMVRDTTEGKPNPSLCLDGPMLMRWAVHLTAGAKKYSARNWMKAAGDEERQRFKESAFRHFLQWYYGDTDEDHAAAVLFNVNGAEYVKEQLAAKSAPDPFVDPNYRGI